MRYPWLTVLAAFAAACRVQPSPIVLQGSRAELSALAGAWEGEFNGSQTGRGGVITFTLQAGRDTAYGDVMLMPVEGRMVVAADAATAAHQAHAGAAEVLRISFVRVAGGSVEGLLEPYVGPDCQCVLTTVFRGTLRGGTIEGEFVSRGDFGLRRTGTWRVQRKPAS